MPRSPNLRQFSEKWLQLFDWFEAHPDTEYRVPTENRKRARAFRFEFYRARVALQNEPELRSHYPNTMRREASIEPYGSDGAYCVVLRLREAAPIATLLEESLKHANGDDCHE